MMEFTQPEALLAQGVMLLVALAVGCRELWLLARGRSGWWPLRAGRLPRLPVPWPWVPGFIIGVLGLIALGLGFVALFIAVFGILALVRLTGRSPQRLWGLKGTDWPHTLALGARAYLAILIPISLIAALSLNILDALGWDAQPQLAVRMFVEAGSGWEIFNLTLTAVLIAPLLEEFIFRGFLYPAIKNHLGRGWAVASTSLLFGLSHAHLLSLLPLTALGVVLALVYDQTGRLGYAIALHSFFNSVTCAIILIEIYAG